MHITTLLAVFHDSKLIHVYSSRIAFENKAAAEGPPPENRGKETTDLGVESTKTKLKNLFAPREEEGKKNAFKVYCN